MIADPEKCFQELISETFLILLRAALSGINSVIVSEGTASNILGRLVNRAPLI